MNKQKEQVLTVVRQTILDLMRDHQNISWAPDEYWWYGVQFAWTPLDYFRRQGEPVKENDLYWALIDLDVPRSCITKRGAHTYVELDNITFVYRTRHFKNGYEPLEIAPHMKGLKFRQCGHSFIQPRGSVYEWAQRMIDLDRWIPEIKEVATQACYDGMQEQKIREIKLETARVFLLDFFKGELPSAIMAYEISDSTPGACDLIRLTIHDEGTPFWKTRLFDIPYDMRDYLLADDVQTFIDECGLQFGALEMFEDEETGIKYPITSYRPYLSETEMEGLLDGTSRQRHAKL